MRTPSGDVGFCVVAIFGCHLNVKGNLLSQHLFPRKRRRPRVVLLNRSFSQRTKPALPPIVIVTGKLRSAMPLIRAKWGRGFLRICKRDRFVEVR